MGQVLLQPPRLPASRESVSLSRVSHSRVLLERVSRDCVSLDSVSRARFQWAQFRVNSVMITEAGHGHVDAGARLGVGAQVHESAYIDRGATLGNAVRVWHFCHVMSDAIIGDRSSLGQNVVVMRGVRIGQNVKIQNNVSVYEGVELEDDVFCGPSMVFTNVFNPRSAVSRKDEYRRTLVQRGASIGANATIVCGSTVGAYAFVGAGAVVNRDVPDYAMVAGVPARRIGWMSEAGHKLVSLGAPSNGGADERLRCPESGEEYVRSGDIVTRLDTFGQTRGQEST